MIDLLLPARPEIGIALVAALPFGVFWWTFMEYTLHRFAFHEARGSNYGSREHLRHHGSDDTVLESWYLSWTGVLLVGLALFPLLGGAIGFAAAGWGAGIGYVAAYGFYDLIHWRAHRRPVAGGRFGRYEARVRKHHFIHHFHAPLQNHGVTTALWDRVFGTLVEADVVSVPRRLALRWLVDEDGAVRPEYAHAYAIRGSRALDETQRAIDRDRAFANAAPTI